MSDVDTFFSAVINGDVNKVTEIFSRNQALLNEQNENEYTAFHLAVLHNKPKIVLILLLNGSDVDKKNDDGKTPLELLDEFLAEKETKKMKKISGKLHQAERKRSVDTSFSAPSTSQAKLARLKFNDF